MGSGYPAPAVSTSLLHPLCLLFLLPVGAACSDYTLQGPDADTGEPVADTGEPAETDSDTEPWDGPPIAILTGEYDSVEDIADSLELDYDLLSGTGWDQINLLSNPEELEKYDAILFNCGMGDGWMAREDEVAANLADYVHGGGSIYVSDWSYWLVEVSFPDLIDFIGDDATWRAAEVGEATQGDPVDATVLDPAMVAALGTDSASITYDIGDWTAVESVGTDAGAMVEGRFTWSGDAGSGAHTGPLVVEGSYGQGKVIFTTFHDTAQTSEQMHTLLEQIILSL